MTTVICVLTALYTWLLDNSITKRWTNPDSKPFQQTYKNSQYEDRQTLSVAKEIKGSTFIVDALAAPLTFGLMPASSSTSFL